MKNHKSKTELVYETLKKYIITGKWEPGERRNADEIANMLKVSRSPVIAASKLLETEGLLKILPQVGMEVPKLTEEGVEEIFYLRGALSGLATAHACQHLKQKQLKKLKDLAELMDWCVLKNDHEQFSKLNREFHYTIFRNCKLSHLVILLSKYWDSGNRYAHFFSSLPKIMVSSATNHHEILEALEKRDEKTARIIAEKDSVDFGLEASKFMKMTSTIVNANSGNKTI